MHRDKLKSDLKCVARARLETELVLTLLRLHNFKTFLSTEVRFSPTHLLLGRNSSGKTSLVKAIQFLSLTSSSDLLPAAEAVPGGIAELCNWRLKGDVIEIGCECDLDLEGQRLHFRYDLHLARRLPSISLPAQELELRVLNERLSVAGPDFKAISLIENDGKESVIFDEEQQFQPGDAPRAIRTQAPRNATMLSRLYELGTNRRAVLFREFLGNWSYYSISPLAIRTGWTSSPSSIFPGLDVFGSNLSNAIFHLKNADERRYRRLIKHVKIVENSLESILFVPVPDSAPVPFVELEGQPRASWNGLSDGTLRTLALALIIEHTASLSPPNARTPSLAIIEEPENGIFPGLLREIYDLFEEWSPSAQFIFTSHSPYFINMFDDKREAVSILRKTNDRSEIIAAPDVAPPEEIDRLTLSEEYASEIF